MKLSVSVAAAWSCFSFLATVNASDPTDTMMNGDSAQSGYLPNHNMDPNIITGGSFGQLWSFKATIPAGAANDQFYAKPLVYTPSKLGRQVVLAFSEANRIYVIDAVNGTLIASRDLGLEGEGPFKVSDLPSCNDIGQTIGITGTPVIDPSTDTVYFWAKGYMQTGQSGWQNGAYRFHAVDASTLAEKPGFPTNIQGAMADNDNTRWFTGGSHLQRASLNLVNGVIFAGFSGHCDLFNYTGWAIGMSTSGKYVTGYTTSGGPGSIPEDGTWTGGGGGCGVWMSGAAIASDNSGRIFFATGNGKGATVNQQTPASGRVYLSTLSECIVNLAVNKANGSLTQSDYFEPSSYLGMDAGDRDLGSGGVCLPDPSVFSGGGVSRIAITCGKNGVCYITNADNLGGFKNGAGGGDAVIQTLTPPGGGSVFSNAGTYPLEGGYMYVTPVGQPTYVYSLGFDTSGRPAFTLVSQTPDSSPGAVGVGPPTITTLNGKAGTAILWIVDTNGIRAYNAVPVNGVMQKITLPALATNPSKFQRPVFGNGRYYMTSLSGSIYGFGAPVAVPMNCTSPIDFGSISIGDQVTMLVNCTTNIAITQIKGLAIGKTTFTAQNSSLPQGSMAAGNSFSFPVTFNLTGYVLNAGSTSAPTVQPGVVSTGLSLFTINAVPGYSTEQGITLTGTAVSASPFLVINPLQISFPAIVIGSSNAASTSTFIVSNAGQSDLTILGYAWSNENGGPYTNITVAQTMVLDSNGYWTSQNIPALNTIIPAGGSITVTATFNTSVIGSFSSIFNIFSDGGQAYTIFSGSANTAPVALLEDSTNEGGWLTIPDCGDPSAGCTVQVDIGTATGSSTTLKTIRFTNNGGSNLIITKSKPPVGTILGATNPSTDLSEGLTIAPGAQSSASIYFQPGSVALNSDPIVYSGAWTLNVNDLLFGVHVLNFTGTLAAPLVGPLMNTGLARFQYLGCYTDGAGARIEATQTNNVNNTNGFCQNKAFAAGVPFAGTEYRTECWTGFSIPPASAKADDAKCTTYTCPGDPTQYCGGYGGYLSLYYDRTMYDPVAGAFIGGYSPPGPPPRVGSYQYIGCYTDNIAARSLSGGNVGNAKTNSLETCATACKGSKYFGTEYSTECYCGSTLAATAVLEPDSQCNMLCPGNLSEVCGAASRLTLYMLNSTLGSASSSVISSSTPSSSSTISSSSSSSISVASSATTPVTSAITPSTTDTSFSANSSATTLSTSTANSSATLSVATNFTSATTLSTTDTSSSANSSATTLSTSTANSSATLTVATNFTSATTLSTTDTSSSANPSATTLSTSTANSSATLTVATNFTSATTLSTPDTSSSANPSATTLSTSIASSSAASSVITTVGTVTTTPASSLVSSSSGTATPTSPWVSLGCVNDTVGQRALTNANEATSLMTVEACQSFCLTKNYPLAGVEYGKQCYCGLDLSNGASSGYSGCTMPCAGNASEFCGGPSRINVYNYTSYVYPVIVQSVGKYNLQGCFVDSIATRDLSSYQYTSSTNMTIENCVNTCQSKGYAKAGLEYAKECYCGNTLAATATAAPAADCANMFCTGNQTEFCGGPSRLYVYSSI
ncbi:WSC-domain-containing protein [Lepidopterella palustris CBS 459.81]|uniref:WSC-domain-containing protein n=1 Tax=Lepidopterella palustris CBS 459.81 TaxID=1314670 RepID=A0A8E2E4X4_9PEZI|nr:WSC-domain-containing protein [Lepidopterella palustris CBS 459.81]